MIHEPITVAFEQGPTFGELVFIMRWKLSLVTMIAILCWSEGVFAQGISPAKVAQCETDYRAKGKAEKAAAPKGYKPDRPKGYKAEFLAKCLSS